LLYLLYYFFFFFFISFDQHFVHIFSERGDFRSGFFFLFFFFFLLVDKKTPKMP